MAQVKIKFGEQELVLKQSFRSLMEFETMTGKNAYEANTSINDSMTIFYCMLKAANKDVFVLSFDAFLDALDENPDMLNQFNAFLLDAANSKAEDTTTKKKVGKR